MQTDIAFAALRCQQQLERIASAVDRLSDAITLPYQEHELQQLSARLHSIHQSLYVTAAQIEMEVDRWGL
jgi:hypothetical protein